MLLLPMEDDHCSSEKKFTFRRIKITNYEGKLVKFSDDEKETEGRGAGEEVKV